MSKNPRPMPSQQHRQQAAGAAAAQPAMMTVEFVTIMDALEMIAGALDLIATVQAARYITDTMEVVSAPNDVPPSEHVGTAYAAALRYLEDVQAEGDSDETPAVGGTD